MEVHCPNCSARLTVASLQGAPTLCQGCEKSVYFPHNGHFPAIVALTFPSQASPAVELVPFFHVSLSQLAAELQQEPPGTTRPLQMMSEQQAQTLTEPPTMDELRAGSPEAEAQVGGHHGGNGSMEPQQLQDADIPVVDPQPIETTPLDAQPPVQDLAVSPQGNAQPPIVEPPAQQPPAVAASGEDNLELLSLAGGSFAAALTPPPMPQQKPAGPPTLQSMSTLGPAPWDTVAPPPIAGKEGKDEGWSVSNGPPPLAKGNGSSGPPAIPKKSEADSFAESLGLPVIPQNDRPEKAPPPAVVVPVATPATPGEDAAQLKRFRKRLYLVGGIAIFVAAVVAIIIGSMANKDLEKPPEVVPDTPPAVSGATAPPTGTSGAVAPVDPKNGKVEKPVDPQKRAAALEHYSKGNKFYLQRKYADALTEYKRALDADANFALAYRGLGVTYASQNKREKAIESYKAYLRLAPDAKDAGQVKAIIQKAESEK